MKLVPALLLNVVTVVLAVLIYDQVRGETPGSSDTRALRPADRAADSAEFERRLAALEAVRRESLRAVGTDAGIFERLAALEEAARRDGSGGLAAEQASDERIPEKEGAATPMRKRNEPSESEVLRFRQVREAVRRDDSVKKNQKRVDGALDKLSIRLTKRQRKRVHAALAAFEPRVGEIWTEVKTQARATIAAGGEVDRGEIVTSTQALIQKEFAATLTDVVSHEADAAAIAEALMPGRK